eukprot:TRINITY_DN75581_c0_g1_i1.p1 TRINITY_DN75581_c0_g1~~TRINITY_DN75581_c0_g1_i1.p1  ORF type:complete len:660 (-),score=82.79 TRINITY_DN75581_c0_g1_i1:16-1887(-)
MAMDEALSQLSNAAGSDAPEALALLLKILQNLSDHPDEPKFRRLNPASAKLQNGLLRYDGATALLQTLGFAQQADGTLELPEHARPSAVEAQSIIQRRCNASQQSQPTEMQSGEWNVSASYTGAVEGGARNAGLSEIETIKKHHEGIQSLEVFERIITNIRRYPDTEKYRCINLDKPAGQKVLPALALMEVAGFRRMKLSTGEECMKLARPHVDVLERVWAMTWWAIKSHSPCQELQAFDGITDFALGAVLGVAVGDALGAPLGGKGPFEVTAAEVDKAMEMCGGGAWNVAPGQITGNAELAICLLACLVEGGTPRQFSLDDLALRYGNWGKSMPFRADGASLKAFQRPLPAEDMAERARSINQLNTGCGPLVRCNPAGAFAAMYRQPTHAISLARSDARLSHPNPTVANASAVLALAVGHLVVSRGDRAYALSEVKQWFDSELSSVCSKNSSAADQPSQSGWSHLSRGTQERVGQRAEEVPWSPPGESLVATETVGNWLKRAITARQAVDLNFSSSSAEALLTGEAGSAEIPFTHAFWHLKNGSSFEVAMRATLAGGGDTTTNAAVVGGLIGAATGLKGIPERWVRAVLASDLSLGQQRPPEYHPSCVAGLLQRVCPHSEEG